MYRYDSVGTVRRDTTRLRVLKQRAIVGTRYFHSEQKNKLQTKYRNSVQQKFRLGDGGGGDNKADAFAPNKINTRMSFCRRDSDLKTGHISVSLCEF